MGGFRLILTISSKYEVLSIVINELDLKEDLSKLLNITTDELNLKLNQENGNDFYHDEVILICDYLGTDPDILFFTK